MAHPVEAVRVILDLFAGAGGWDVAARDLGLSSVVGIELDAAACATRHAAGLATIRADVASFPLDHLAGRVGGLIASPPCTDFSRAGTRAGLAGETGPLVYEVMRWTTALRPAWIACEQVPDVLPIWRQFCDELSCLGYSTWSGLLDAADYGVPQNRTRAILLASRVGRAAPPAPTHSRTGHEELFGGGRLRWVAMADALSWGFDTPARTVCGDRCPRWAYGEGDSYATGLTLRTGGTTTLGDGRVERYERSVDRPAPTVDTKAARGQWKLSYPGRSYDADALTRPADEPTPAVALGHNARAWCWERPATTVMGDARVFPPGGHHPESGDPSWSTRAVPVELWELGVLQGFDAAFPWQGNKTERARQIGNAIPVGLARAVLSAVVGAQARSAA